MDDNDLVAAVAGGDDAGLQVGALAAGATGGYLPGGTLVKLRNLGGVVGSGLLFAGHARGRVRLGRPMAYLLVTESALSAGWTTPWVWPHDLGGALCTVGVFTAGSRPSRSSVPVTRTAGPPPK